MVESESRFRAEKQWEMLFHQDRLFASRASFFMVAAALCINVQGRLAVSALPDRFLAVLMTCVGMFFCLVWWYVSWSTKYHTDDILKSTMDKEFDWYGRLRDGRAHLIGVHTLLGLVLPCVLLVAQVVLCLYILCR